ncbi:hypothetical protein EYZ11_009364 [Aspergillus tanneri]|uniref:ATP-grasp domain-containing protein n=1 Tax=Aspergillus tanneri TaxID=1220188 RepID=A0A4S3J8I0_9EURO|nr:hypothetical protein EYZ11_009364 [Aspergillus tanneri]
METDFSRLPNFFAVAAGGIIIDVHESINDVAADLDAFEKEDEITIQLQKPSISTWWFWMPKDAGWRIRSMQICVALFLPCDLTRDGGLCYRIIETLSHYKGGIDGIVTFHESLQFEVAKAAEILSLPTPPAAALAIAADKYKTSIAAGHPALLAHGKDEALQAVQEHKLQYPLILKPCRGWGSSGVYRADNTLEFAEAAEAIAKHADLHGPRFVIEEYCDGPEVDVNLVLSEGEILFAEVCDE